MRPDALRGRIVRGRRYARAVDDRNESGLAQIERVRLEALRYAVNEEAASYLAIMRTFTGAISGLLSDQSAAEVARRLAAQGMELSVDYQMNFGVR